MDGNVSYYTLPCLDSDNGDSGSAARYYTSYTENLLETDDAIRQFLSADGPIEEPDLNGPLHCEICAKKFDSAKKYYGHLRVHSKDNLWTCDKCPSLKFSTKQQLMKHTLSHQPLQRVFKCPQCSIRFEYLYKLHSHLYATHTNYRPHKCEECEKSFQKLSDLKKHQSVHNGQQAHACEECGQRFSNVSNLSRHARTHRKEQPYCCAGCGRRYTQACSLNRHTAKCPKYRLKAGAGAVAAGAGGAGAGGRRSHCRVCGASFQYKSALLEHCVRTHRPTVDAAAAASHDVSGIVDDILSAEAAFASPTYTYDHFTRPDVQPDVRPDTRPDTRPDLPELLHELQNMDDELFYNNLDLDMNTAGLPSEQQQDMFDFGAGVDQDLLSALTHVKSQYLPEDLLNAEVAEDNFSAALQYTNSDCATIFESDVDLEASTNLAASLNHLIGQNSVQYVSTEDDDTFIISLDSGIDAEKLTDILNMDVRVQGQHPTEAEADAQAQTAEAEADVSDEGGDKSQEDAIVLKMSGGKTEESGAESKKNLKVKMYICRKCNRVFKKKDNYQSHLATHSASLRRHACPVCARRFAYRSSLNKHARAAHCPRTLPAHACGDCPRVFSARWLLKIHRERDHAGSQPHACSAPGCRRRFYMQWDLTVHMRSHTGETPYRCEECGRRFHQLAHLYRHRRRVHASEPRPAADAPTVKRKKARSQPTATAEATPAAQ